MGNSTTQKHGPYSSPFVAACKALAATNNDTIEFSTFGMWGMCGEYDFHGQSEHFIPDLIEFMRDQWSIHVDHGPDGFYAWKEAEDD